MHALLLALALASPNRIAVLDVHAHTGVEATLATGITDDLVAEVRQKAVGATVIGADDIRTLIGLEKQKQMLGCAESSCLAEIGGALGAKQIVSGSVNRFGNTYLLVVKLLDSRTGRVVHQASSRFSGEGAILDVVANAVDQLFPPATGTVPPGALSVSAPQPAPQSHSHALSIVLGSSGLVCGGIAIYGLVDVLNYQSIQSGGQTGTLTYSNVNSQLGAAKNWQVASIVLGVAAVGLATAAVFTW